MHAVELPLAWRQGGWQGLLQRMWSDLLSSGTARASRQLTGFCTRKFGCCTALRAALIAAALHTWLDQSLNLLQGSSMADVPWRLLAVQDEQVLAGAQLGHMPQHELHVDHCTRQRVRRC